MSLIEKIKAEVKEAMKQKDTVKLSTLRMLNSAIKNTAIDKRKETLDDSEVIEVVSRAVKQHKDSIENYKNANREELVEQEQKELNILMEYMPEQMSEDEIRKIAADSIAEIGEVSVADFGKVMGQIMSKVKGKADGNIVTRIVKEELNK